MAGKFIPVKCEGKYELNFAVDIEKLRAKSGIEMEGNTVTKCCDKPIDHTLRRDGTVYVKAVSLQDIKDSWGLMQAIYRDCAKG